MTITAQSFAEQSQISEKLAKKILDRIYEKKLDAMDMPNVIWKLKDWFLKNEFGKLLEKASTDTIDAMLDEVIADRIRWQTRVDAPSSSYSDQTSITPESAWFFTALTDDITGNKEFKAGDKVDIQILRVGNWKHPIYGPVKITAKTINDVIQNFKDNKRGVEICADENHDPNHKALAWFRNVYAKGKSAAFATLELTTLGAKLLNDGAYKFFSPELALQKTDEETGEKISNLLLGGAFTNRPFFKGMQPLLANEEGTAPGNDSQPGEIEHHILLFSDRKNMFKYLTKLGDVAAADAKALTNADRTELEQLFNELPEEERNRDDMKARHDEALQKFAEPEATPAPAAPADAPATPPAAPTDGTDNGTPPAPVTPPVAPAEPATPPAPADSTVNASEDVDVTLKASEVTALKNDQKKLAGLIRDARRRDMKDKITGMQFSEKERPASVILPKDVEPLTEFAISLSEDQAEKFIGIIKNLRNVHIGELGDGGNADTAKFSEEQVQWYMEHMQMTREEAIKASEDFIVQQGA